jgi:hypothetical protein
LHVFILISELDTATEGLGRWSMDRQESLISGTLLWRGSVPRRALIVLGVILVLAAEARAGGPCCSMTAIDA